MQQMNTMMNSMLADPFGMLGFGGSNRRGRSRDALMPFGFPNMNDIFGSFVSELLIMSLIISV